MDKVGIFIAGVAALLTAFYQMGWFSKSASEAISIEAENPTIEIPKVPKINSAPTVRSPQKNIFPKRTTLNTVKVGDLTATMQGCQRLDKQLLCSVLLTDTKASNNLIVFNNYQSSKRRYRDNTYYPRERVRILDFDGNEYTSEKVKVGDIEGEYFVKSQTIENVGIRIIATFPEVPPKTQKLAAIAIPLKLSHDNYTNENVIRIHLQSIDISQ